jgi:NusA-like KH domain protein
MAVIDMKTMRYINLFDRISRVRTNNCFVHNNAIFFAVKREEISRAIGPAASNVKKMQAQLGIRVRIIREADGIWDAKRFIEDIVSPVKLKSVEAKEGVIIVAAGSNQNKAVLIGRNKRRYEELKKIVHDFFNMDLRIV